MSLLSARIFAVFLVALLGAPVLLQGQPKTKGFDHFYNLEYDEAIAAFEKEVADAPGDPAAYNHLAQALLYSAMYKSGSLESELVTGNNPFLRRAKMLPPEREQRRFDTCVNEAKRISQERLARNANDLQAKYLLGVTHGLNANYNFLVRKLWRESLKEFTLARKYHNEVSAADPKNVDALLIEGVHDYIVGSLPVTWKMLGFLFGFRGDKEGGIRTVERVSREGNANRVDAMIALGVAYRRERKPDKAIPLLEKLVQLYPRNHLYRFEMVQMHADAGNKDAALAVLARMEEMRQKGVAGFKALPAGKIQYARGNLLFWYREFPQALENLQAALTRPQELDLNTLVSAHLRKGQTLDMLGQRGAAMQAYQQAVQEAPDSDAAKLAAQYLRSPYRRKPDA